jgi:hypothetical protein
VPASGVDPFRGLSGLRDQFVAAEELYERGPVRPHLLRLLDFPGIAVDQLGQSRRSFSLPWDSSTVGLTCVVAVMAGYRGTYSAYIERGGLPWPLVMSACVACGSHNRLLVQARIPHA